MPSPTCTRNSPATTATYLPTARIEGVRVRPLIGSSAGGVTGSSVSPRDAIHHTTAPTPASSTVMLITVQRIFAPVGRFPTSGSCGQLLVYVTVLSGRSVVAAQLVQKKKCVRASS